MTKPTKFEANRWFGVYVFNGNWNYPFSVEMRGDNDESDQHRVSSVVSLDELLALKATISHAIAYYNERQEEEELKKVAEEISTDSTRLAVMPPAFYDYLEK